jgi:hypothetical protein
MRLVRLLEQAVFREYHRIVNDNALLYGTDFVSTNSDFYTNKERRESFGCLVSNMLAQQYHLEVSDLRRVVLFFVVVALFRSSNLTLSLYHLELYRMDDVCSLAIERTTTVPKHKLSWSNQKSGTWKSF